MLLDGVQWTVSMQCKVPANTCCVLDSQDGSPPLHSAVSGNHWDVVQLLIEKYHASPIDGATDVRCLI